MDLWETRWSATKKRPYYFNAATRTSMWTAPPSMALSSTTALQVRTADVSSQVPLTMDTHLIIGKNTDMPNMANNTASHQVSAHYNQMTAQSKTNPHARDASTHLRGFNNWIKAWLIHTYGQNKTVLDLACGRGQDLNKWARAGCPNYVGVDISTAAVAEASRRSQTQFFRFASCVCFDLSTAPFCTEPPKREIVACMFAFHYFWKSEQTLRCFLATVVTNLVAGGKVLLTFPDAAVIKHHLARGTVVGNTRTASNGLFRLTMDEKHWQALSSANTSHAFGWPYLFTLPGAVEDCVEYFVIMSVLERMLCEFQLHVVKTMPFQELVHELIARNEFVQQLRDMRVLNERDSISVIEWECVGLYQAVVLEFRCKS